MNDLFEYYIESDGLHFKYAKGEPAVREQEFHDYCEFVFFIKGNSYLISKNIQQELTPGNIVMIPKEHFHQFCIGEPETYVRCILGFRDTSEIAPLAREIMDTIKIISSPDTRTVSMFEQLMEVAKSDLSHEEKIMYIRASLIQLLIHLKMNPSDSIYRNVNLSPVVIRALAVIDEKYRDDLSVDTIAGLLYVSPSTLAHKFSRELNISLYHYIIKKRLSVANELIKSGEPMSSAALNSGFNDYSCFYRLYKKYYQKSSKKTNL